MRGTREDRRLATFAALLQAHAAVVEGVEADLEAQAGLPLSWHEVLVRLSHAGDEGMRMQDLARSVLLSKSGLTRLADRMEEAGLLERRACSADRRGTFVVSTALGSSTLRGAAPVFARAVDGRLAPQLSAEDLDRLTEALERGARANGRGEDEACASA